MVKVSIIIPVYNAEKYLEQCVDSCLNQTLKETEIILVNDASTDASGKIIEKYVEKYPQKIIAISLKENIRQGGARNRGIEVAKGKYLCFVDADDYIDINMCEKLYQLCIQKKLDIASSNGFRIQNEQFMYFNTYKKFDFAREKSIIHFTSQCYMLVKKDIIVRNNLYFPLRLYCEDTAVVPIWYMLAEKKELLNEPLYFRRVHPESTTQSLNITGISQVLLALEILVKNAKRCELYEGNNKALLDDFIFSRMIFAIKLFLKKKSVFAREDFALLRNVVRKWRDYSFDETFFFNHISRTDYNLGKKFIENFDECIQLEWEDYSAENNSTGYPDREDKILQLINKIQEMEKDLVIWGAGQECVPLIATIRSCGAEYYVCDNNPQLWNKELMTKDVVRNPDWIREKVKNPVFFILAERYYDDIVKELRKFYNRLIAVDVFAYLMYDLTTDGVLGEVKEERC